VDTELDIRVEPEPVGDKVALCLDVAVGAMRIRYTALLGTDVSTELCSALLNVVHRIARSGDSGGRGAAHSPAVGQDQ
jgi:hypothetical protein